jgi:large subunit ribosomal protein L32
MGVPKRKRSRPRRDKRHANKGIKPKSVTACTNCAAPLATHQACRDCGFYKGAKILATKADRAVKRNQLNTARAQRKQSRAPMSDSQQ